MDGNSASHPKDIMSNSICKERSFLSFILVLDR